MLDSIDKNPLPENLTDDSLLQIGKCAGCGESAQLVSGACSRCRKVFGEKCGVIFHQIRKDMTLAKRIYEILDDDKKTIFVQFFGLPR